MATLYRLSDGEALEVLVLDVGASHPADVWTQPVEADVPREDHRQTLARQWDVQIGVSAALGPAGVLEHIDWIYAAQDGGLVLVLDDGRETPELTLGTWSESRTTAEHRLALSLTERLVAVSRSDVVRVQPAPAPRADQQSAASDEADRGKQGTEEASESLAVQALKAVGIF